VVEALNMLMHTEKSIGEIFNVGNNEEVSIEELAERIRRMSESRSEIVHIPYSQAYEEGFEDMFRRVPSLEKIGRCIGYRPKTSLDEIIDKVVSFERDRRFRIAGVATGIPMLLNPPVLQQPSQSS
jgi:UDP-glucose 4-epimerase